MRETMLATARHEWLRLKLRWARLRSKPASLERLMEGRELFEAVAAMMGPPPGVTLIQADANGVPAEWTSVDGSRDDAVVLYLHGGGYAMGSINTSRYNLAGLVEASGFTGLNVDYRLAPEHPFPAAVDDAVAAYRWLAGKVPPDRIVLSGESAGGGLALALLVRLRDEGDPLPAGCVTVSAWADLDLCGTTYDQLARKDLSLTKTGLGVSASVYLAGADPRHPLASPTHADLTGLPPLLLLASTDEIVLDDTRIVASRARAAGVDVETLLGPRQLHCWTGYGNKVPRARRDLQTVGAWMRAQVDG